MKKLSELLEPACVVPELLGRKKLEVITELVQVLHDAGKITQPDAVLEALIEREKMSSTGLGHGVAIPHRLLPNVSSTLVAFGRKKEGIHYDAIDRQPVRLVFLILGPAGRNSEHLMLLSRLARLLNDDRLRRDLLEAPAARQILEVLAAAETA